MKIKLVALALLTSLSLPPVEMVIAEETMVEKIENKAEKVGKDTKKNYRKAKKKVRDATGNSSVTEDLKDTSKNIGDELEHQGKKIKRKVD